MLHLQLHANNLHTEDKIIIPGDKYLLKVNNKDSETKSMNVALSWKN